MAAMSTDPRGFIPETLRLLERDMRLETVLVELRLVMEEGEDDLGVDMSELDALL